MPNFDVPLPWKQVGSFAVGGLHDVGYADDSDVLMVLSGQGRGIFNALTGERIARGPTEKYNFDAIHLVALGFGPLEGITVRTAGLHGGGLAYGTADGWGMEIETVQEKLPSGASFPVNRVYMTSWAWWKNGKYERRPMIADDSPCELRAYGFSQTGLSCIVATSGFLTLFARGAT